MADAIQTLPNTKNDLIISLVQRELIEAANLAATVTDYSQFAGKGVKRIDVPKLTSFAVSNRAFGTPEDAQALTDAKDSIDLDFNAYVAWLEDHNDILQSTIEYRMEASSRAGRAHGKYVDTQILAELNAIASLNINAAVVADISADNILTMRKHILDAEGRLEDSVLAIGTGSEAAMLAIPEFIRADHYGSSNIPNGQIGQVFGLRVQLNTQIEDGQAYVYSKEGIGMAFQKQPSMSEQRANEYGAESYRVAVDQLFGVGGLQLGVQGAGPAQSPLVAKLKD